MKTLKADYIYKIRNSIIFSLPENDLEDDFGEKIYSTFKKVIKIFRGKVFILDLSNIGLLDSLSATALFKIWGLASKNNAKVIFTGIDEFNSTVLAEKGFNKLFELANSISEAVNLADAYLLDSAKMKMRSEKLEEIFGDIHQKPETPEIPETKLYTLIKTDKKLKKVS